MDTSQITGQVELQGFVGTGTVPLNTRTVTFVATGGSSTKTWALPLSNASGAVFNYTLTQVPAGTTGVSAKTDWNLRRKLTVALVNGQATATFTGNSKLLGGDIAPGTRDNTVNSLDRNVLLGQWGNSTPGNVADINGDGSVNSLDRNILLGNWGSSGDDQ